MIYIMRKLCDTWQRNLADEKGNVDRKQHDQVDVWGSKSKRRQTPK